MTPIPYQTDATSVGPARSPEVTHNPDTRNFFPKQMKEGTRTYKEENRVIRCRLLFAQYSRPEAIARCIELHGTAFDQCFVAGRYFVFRSAA